MAIKYNLSLHELMDFLYGQDYEGFTEQEIQAVEHKIGVKLPNRLPKFFTKIWWKHNLQCI